MIMPTLKPPCDTRSPDSRAVAGEQPRFLVEEAPCSHPRLGTPATRKKRILLADDDEGVRTSLSQVLAIDGYEVLPAANGRQAVAWLRSELPDLALLDIHMPGLDGWRTLERIERRRPFLPLIVITARPHQYARAVGSGVDALMEKPLHLPLLLEAIGELLAEPLPQRLARLTRSDFATRHLTPPPGTAES